MPLLEEKQVLALLSRAGEVVRLRVPDGDRAVSAVGALRRAGFTAFEVDTLGAGPASRAFSVFRKDPFLLAGAGTAVTPGEVEEAAREGASWAALPGPGEELMKVGREAGLLLLVRVRLEEEIEAALALGAACILLASPLAEILAREEKDPAWTRRGLPALALEAPWESPLPGWASFKVVTSGLFPPALLEEGSFHRLENLVRRMKGVKERE